MKPHQRQDPPILDARGASMSPTLENGDRLEVERDSEVAVGDLAVFLGHEKLVAHRVVKITGQQLWVRGDNLSGSPEVVPASGVLGKVAVIHRRDGRTIDLASTGQRVWKKTWNLSPRLARFLGRCAALPRGVRARVSR